MATLDNVNLGYAQLFAENPKTQIQVKLMSYLMQKDLDELRPFKTNN